MPAAKTRLGFAYWVVGSVVGAIHLALFARDLTQPDGFLRADRARFRYHAMKNLIAAGHEDYASFVACLVKQGIIGDYGIHAAFYAIGGAPAVIFVQVLLAIAAALCVVYIAWHTFLSRNLALAAGLLYAVLPQSIAFPHQLLSESIANPFLIFGTAAVVYGIQSQRKAPIWLLSGLAFGVAGLVRPALMLLPLIAAVLLAWFGRGVGNRKAALLAASGIAPFVLWCTFMLLLTGRFGPGESTQDLGLNFSQSTAKVLLSEADSLPPRLTAGQYLHYVALYPKGFANLYAKNIMVMVMDSGIGRLYVDLLGYGAEERQQLQDPVIGWRAQLTNHGPLAMLQSGWRLAPGTIIAGVLGAIGFAVVNIGTAFAYVILLRRGSPLADPGTTLAIRWCVAFLLIVPLYVLATSEVVAYAPSRLRSQGEFAWAILACFGWSRAWYLLRFRSLARGLNGA
jgi:4-amino-4-deoxy-L-arabinose transferase-like glycosyltransferase